MIVYSYHSQTHIYTGIDHADPDPMNPGKWLAPGNSTRIKPPFFTEKQYIVFDNINKKWIIKEKPEIPYYILRARSYPPITDYLDGVVKGDQQQIDKYIEQCNEVKKKFPKPTFNEI